MSVVTRVPNTGPGDIIAVGELRSLFLHREIMCRHIFRTYAKKI